MKCSSKLMVMVAAALLAAVAPAEARAQADLIADLLAKGKDAYNNFNYRSADDIARQLLSMSLTRQQRIDALELRAAANYPDDATGQRADEASKAIRELVQLGVGRITTAELTWRGLDSLYNVVVAQTPVTRAAGFDSVGGIITLAQGGFRADQIVARSNIDCYTFSFDELDQALRRVRGGAPISDALKRSCAKLMIETEPANAMATVAGRTLGTIPARGQVRWVQPQDNAEIVVSMGDRRISRTVSIPRGRVLQAKFFLPQDTIPWPHVRTPIQIAEEMRLYDRFTPTTPRPVAPVRPSGMNAFGYGMIWGILGAAGGYAAAQFIPSTGCVANHTVPPGETWRVNDKKYSSGQTVNLGGGMACTMKIAGASSVGMLMLTSIMKTSKNRAATRRYNDAVQAYPMVLRTWEDTERRTFAERNADVRQALADQQIRLTQAQSENTAIKARNAQLPEPQIFDRDFDYAGNPTATVQAGVPAPTAAPEIVSDVDMRVPLAATPNPDAVAIVIGNRSYRAQGVPDVDFAVRDAKSMKRYLVETFGFSEDRVILDTNVTSGRLSELFGSANDASASRLAELVAARQPANVDVFVFYSGLGAPAGRPSKKYLVPIDANPRRIQTNGYSVDQLYKNLTALKARSVTVAIDAGFGALSSDMFANESFGGALELEVGTVGGLNAQVLAATSGDQTPKWRRDQGHGLFTYFLLRGLQGSADANGDFSITAGELQAYLAANVKSYAAERMSGAVQVPEIFTSNPNRVVVQIKSGT